MLLHWFVVFFDHQLVRFVSKNDHCLVQLWSSWCLLTFTSVFFALVCFQLLEHLFHHQILCLLTITNLVHVSLLCFTCLLFWTISYCSCFCRAFSSIFFFITVTEASSLPTCAFNSPNHHLSFLYPWTLWFFKLSPWFITKVLPSSALNISDSSFAVYPFHLCNGWEYPATPTASLIFFDLHHGFLPSSFMSPSWK